MTPAQRDAAARILAEIVQLPPADRTGVLSLVCRVLAGSGVAQVETEPDKQNPESTEAPQ